MLLHIPPHKDHLEQLEAISLLVTNTLSKQALDAAAANKDKSKNNEHRVRPRQGKLEKSWISEEWFPASGKSWKTAFELKIREKSWNLMISGC